MVPLSIARATSEHSLDEAEPCLPSSQACGLEDSEPGRSWLRQRKEEDVPEGQRRRRGFIYSTMALLKQNPPGPNYIVTLSA